jgi:Tol biopolymer transport system component
VIFDLRTHLQYCGVLKMKKMAVILTIVIVLCSLILIVLPATADVSGKIAFASNREGVFATYKIYVMNADGSDQSNLNPNQAIGKSPAWSPDGSKIAFESDKDGNLEIYVMNSDGTGQKRLTTNSANDVEPAWSPDGSKIAFRSDRDGNFEIYKMNSDGTGQKRLTTNSAYDGKPDWSPDGSKIAFESDRDGNWEIYVMNSDGTGQKPLTTNSANDIESAWSPDGSKIAFRSDRDGNWEIYVMNSDGTGQKRLTTTLYADGGPDWSPDGSKIVYSAPLESNTHIYVMNPDGTGKTAVTSGYHNDIHPSWGPEPVTRVPVSVRLLPRTINLGNKGYLMAFVTLPEAYRGATIDMKTVSCSGAPAVRMIRSKIFPRIVGFVFKTSSLQGVEVGKKATLTLNGELKNAGKTYIFRGFDTINVVSKPTWQPDDIKDVSEVSDEQLFKKYSL